MQKTRNFRELEQFEKVVPVPGFFCVILCENIFTDIHIEQFRLAHAALQVEVLQNGLRKQAVDIIKVSASGDYERAAELVKEYIMKVEIEKENAEEVRKNMETTIQVRGLSKSYTRNKVIENINLSVAAGEVYGLLEANGVGKSTTIECILGTQRADSGTVRILGLDPWENRTEVILSGNGYDYFCTLYASSVSSYLGCYLWK